MGSDVILDYRQWLGEESYVGVHVLALLSTCTRALDDIHGRFTSLYEVIRFSQASNQDPYLSCEGSMILTDLRNLSGPVERMQVLWLSTSRSTTSSFRSTIRFCKTPKHQNTMMTSPLCGVKEQ